MSELFTTASKIYRDELVSELQMQNKFLRNQINLKSIKDKLSGVRVRILSHLRNSGQNTQAECIGKLINIEDYYAHVLIRLSANKIIPAKISLDYIIIEDDKIEDLFNDNL
jgi:hypothetical protein